MKIQQAKKKTRINTLGLIYDRLLLFYRSLCNIGRKANKRKHFVFAVIFFKKYLEGHYLLTMESLVDMINNKTTTI